MAAKKLEPEKFRQVLGRLAIGASAASLYRELIAEGIEIAESTVRSWRNRAKESGELEEIRKNLAKSFPEFEKDARIVGRVVDLERIEKRLAGTGHLNAEEFIRHVNMANKIRDSIARDTEGGFGSTKFSQQVSVGGKTFEDRMHEEHEKGPAWKAIDREGILRAKVPDSGNGDKQEETTSGNTPTNDD